MLADHAGDRVIFRFLATGSVGAGVAFAIGDLRGERAIFSLAVTGFVQAQVAFALGGLPDLGGGRFCWSGSHFCTCGSRPGEVIFTLVTIG